MCNSGDAQGDDAPAKPICPNCAEANHPLDHFCRKCGRPMTVQASTMPLERIWAEGWVWRKMVSCRRPGLLVLTGTWLIFGTSFAFGILALILGIFGLVSLPTWPDLVVFPLVVLYLLVVGVILYRVTKNYVIGRRPDSAQGTANPDPPQGTPSAFADSPPREASEGSAADDKSPGQPADGEK